MALDDGSRSSDRFHRLARIIGFALLVLSVVYIVREVSRHWTEILRWQPDTADLVTLGALAIFYAMMLYLLAEVWHRIVNVFGPEPRHRTWRSYALTQIARYLPGNVAHLIGRAVVLRDGPLNTRQLGLATLLELIVFPAGAVVALLIIVLIAPESRQIALDLGWPLSEEAFLASAVLSLAMAGGGLALVARRSKKGYRLATTISVVLVLCTIFMVCLGAVFATIVGLLDDVSVWTACVAGIVAWLVGYATPGAPGGIGPREAMLLFLMSDTASAAHLVIAVAVFRLVTIAGDVVCFGVAAVVLRIVPPRT